MWTVIGDPHAKPDNLDKINQLFDIIEDLGNDCIVLGDLLDTKELVRGKCLNTYVTRLSASKLNFIILVGNHDWFNLECKEHSLEPLKALPNVRIIDKPTKIKGLGWFLPYMKLDALKDFLNAFKKDTTLFCHIDLIGFDYGNGHLSQEGLDQKELLGKYPVISGHYHKYQLSNNITYLGTPFSHSFGESNQIKYIALFEPSTQALQLLETPFQQHITTFLNTDENPSFFIRDNNFHRVVLKGNVESIKNYPRIPGVKYIEQPDTLKKAAVVNETQSPEIQFSKWSKEIRNYTDEVVLKGLGILKDVH